MFRNRNWFGRNIWKPKNVHSLEYLKYLYAVLSKNQNVSESNRGLLVETLRSIAEILIWGDQNDSSVFDFFLEKNMLSFFLKILKQKCGSYVCVQLLQTLNILFENIRNETSLYYLLSNNHVNSIIVHKFDFSDEEVMAYYISFLRTLSLKLNNHTIHFFYNEHTNDFPLYTEAIKFFNHSESMVRIAVRTLTLNVYKVEDKSMLRFIRDKTAVPYFSNIVWFIGSHILELDTCIHNDINQLSGQTRLSDLVAEHLDHLHYLNDILCLNIEDLNIVLIEHLLNKLLLPLYILSLLPSKKDVVHKRKVVFISTPLSLFLLSQVFLILRERQLVHVLALILLKGSPSTLVKSVDSGKDDSLISTCDKNWNSNEDFSESGESTENYFGSSLYDFHKTMKMCASSEEVPDNMCETLLPSINVTDEEKEQRLTQELVVQNGSFLEAILKNLRCQENDYSVLFALGLLHAISTNSGIEKSLLESFFSPINSDLKPTYNTDLIEHLIQIMSISCQSGCRVRLVTLELAIALFKKLVIVDDKSILLDEHYAAVIGAKEGSVSLLRNYYKNEDIFLDIFEDEYYDMKKRPLNIEWLMMDSNLLLQPTNTPMTGVEFSKRLPCGEVERTRSAVRVFLLIRDLVLTLSDEAETQLPLTDRNTCISVGTSLDLSNSDLITCTVVSKDGKQTRRFIAMDNNQLILVEPHSKMMGWGVTKLAGFLEDIEVTSNKEEPKCLHVTIHHTSNGSAFSAKFLFDDHIRYQSALLKFQEGRAKAREKKVAQIAEMLDIPVSESDTSFKMLTARHQSASSILYGSCYKQPPYSASASKTMSNFLLSNKSHRTFDDINNSNVSISGTSYESPPGNKKHALRGPEEIQLMNFAKENENELSDDDTGTCEESCCVDSVIINASSDSDSGGLQGRVKTV